MNEINLNVAVSCLCCKRQKAAFMVKDIGLKTYPVCSKCKASCKIVEEKRIVTGGK